jgi:predicted HAD superfamily Cof-like phosphohydrolase
MSDQTEQLKKLREENELLRAQLIQCTRAMSDVSGVLRDWASMSGVPADAAKSLALILETAHAKPVAQPQDWVRDVLEFQRKFNQPIGRAPGLATIADAGFRLSLIHEELLELFAAVRECATNEIADALADLVYVLIGTATTFGIDLRPVWAEVHRSNMAKEGGPTRADGKILKPEGWQPPDIAAALAKGVL